MNKEISQQLSVMIIGDDIDRHEAIAKYLKSHGFNDVVYVWVQSDLLVEVESNQSGILILDIELPDKEIFKKIEMIYSKWPKPMVMMSRDNHKDTIQQAINVGVSAYVVGGIETQCIQSTIESAVATFKRYQRLQKQFTELSSELNRKKKVDHAKRILMKQRQIDEDAAYRFIRKSAMDNNLKIEEVAVKINDAAELIGIN